MHISFHQEWSNKLIKKILDHYQLAFFSQKKILDLGAGNGVIANSLARFGGNLTCVDAREEKLSQIQKKYPHLKTLKVNLEHNYQFKEFFDAIISIDLLSHLKNAEEHLVYILQFTNHLILETEVLDSDQDEKVSTVENSAVSDWSFSGTATKLSEKKIETIFNLAGFDFKKYSSKDLNTSYYQYDWRNEYQKQINAGKRRLWIAQRIRPIDTTKGIENNLLFSQTTLRSEKPLYQPILTPIVNNIKEIKELKICCLISGHLRSFEFTFGSLLRNIIQPLNAKVFLSSYNVLGFDRSRGDGNLTDVSIDLIREKVISLLRPESYLFEDHHHFDITRWGERAPLVRNTQNVMGMFYKIKSANQLKIDYEKKYGMKFDVCIRLRPDLLIKEPLDLNIIRSVGHNAVWVPNIYHYGIINDQVAIANSEIMNIYSSCFDQIHQSCDDGTIFHPESLLKHHLIKSGVSIKQFRFNYLLQRVSGEQPSPF